LHRTYEKVTCFRLSSRFPCAPLFLKASASYIWTVLLKLDSKRCHSSQMFRIAEVLTIMNTSKASTAIPYRYFSMFHCRSVCRCRPSHRNI